MDTTYDKTNVHHISDRSAAALNCKTCTKISTVKQTQNGRSTRTEICVGTVNLPKSINTKMGVQPSHETDHPVPAETVHFH